MIGQKVLLYSLFCDKCITYKIIIKVMRVKDYQRVSLMRLLAAFCFCIYLIMADLNDSLNWHFVF